MNDEGVDGIESSAPETRLVALPAQLIETRRGVILRRGSIQVLIGGERSLEAVEAVTEALSGEGATIDEVVESFAAPDRPAVKQLVEYLLAHQLVVSSDSEFVAPVPGDELDVFYWQFGVPSGQVRRRLQDVRLVIVGVNHISRQLAHALMTVGLTNVVIIDFPALRNLSFFDDFSVLRTTEWGLTQAPVPYDEWAADLDADSFDCLVATSDFGGLRLMRTWNNFCIENGRHFFPVVLQDMIGYVGPSVIPYETACFECFLSRLDSNRDQDEREYQAEMAAYEGQNVDGLHPSLASVLGDITAIELTKFYSRALPLWKTGTVMEVNLLSGRIDSRKVLRVPRCRVCSNLLRRSSTSMVKATLGAKVVEP